MGNCFGSIFRRRNQRRHIVLILIGLDNAGKTKTVNNLAGEKDDKVLPTVGFKAVNLVHKDTPVTIYDLGGGPHFRQIWSQYYSEVHGVIFVIDSSDFSRLDECRMVLEEVLSHDKISGKPVLVLANKQDKHGALDDIDVVDKLNIEPLVNKYRCPTLVESYSAYGETPKSKKPKLDPGLRKGYQWLLNYIVKRYGDINLRVQTDIHADLERRKRMLNKASNTNSQTFTAVSDDMATQTGFENPNYDLEKSSNLNDDEIHKGLIVVKPIKHNPNSIDSTITIESVDESDETSVAKPKLSPLFGRASHTTVETVRIELEPRSEYRKLSPIVRNKSDKNQHIDFKNRPQSSPSMKRKIKFLAIDNSIQYAHEFEKSVVRALEELVAKLQQPHGSIFMVKQRLPRSVCEWAETLSKNTSFQDEDLKTEGDMTVIIGDRNRSWDGSEKKHRVLVNDAELSQMHREIVLNERDYTSKTAYSEVTLQPATLPLSPRPASASQLVRRQLELCGQHKRRLSLRYMQRNKTSPERVSMLIYEPSKAPQRHLDKGDFEQSATIN